MNTKLLMAGVVAWVLTVPSVFAQTAGEQLQRAIFAQEAQGNIDSAISTYRPLAVSSLAPREVSAHVEYRLSQALLQKGDLTGAAAEVQRLEKNFPEYRTLIESLVAAMRPDS